MMNLILAHCIELFLLVRSKSALIKRISDLFHHIVIEIKIMHDQKTHTKHLLCLEQMSHVSS